MTFKSFNIKYPEYEVITPQTNLSFTVRSLNVQEEEALKGSLITPQKIAEHLNKCIFDSTIKKPKTINTLDEFHKNITLKDRDALLYGLYHITYEDIRNYEIKCTSCDHQFPVTVKASETFNFKPYEGKNVIRERVRVALPASPGVFALIKQPTLFDEISNMKSLMSRPGSTLELITETLIIDSFEQDVEDKAESIVYKDRADVVDAYLSLPAKDKRKIYEQYTKSFGKYGIELKMKNYCPSCGNEDIFDIDLVENFFRALYAA
jgi:predicted RNA-binding Zn-ribbon protein involved in translation (DUF1610 family)